MLITVDLETFYSQTYSLSKMTTEEYIRGDEYETIGVSVKVNDAPAEWFTGTHAGIKNWLQAFAWDKAMVVAHNAMFDMAILSWRFDIHPWVIADTLSMARAIHGVEVGGSLAKLAAHYEIGVKGEEVIQALGKHRKDFTPEDLAAYGRYCCNDTEMTYQLFNILADGYPKNELKLIDQTIKMFSEPVLELDAMLLENHLTSIKQRKEELLARVAGVAGDAKKNIMSNPKFASLLRAHGAEPPRKISLTTGKETYAFAKTDEGLKALLEHDNPNVQTLVAVRLGVKSTIEETRTERFLGIASRGTLPIPLKYYGAHTSRWGGTDKINLQNLPSRGADNSLKRSIRAPEGYVLINADSAQIEARLLAWLAGQHDLVEAFRRKEDVYSIMAAAIYRKPVGEITKGERAVGKFVILGCGYGMGAKKLMTMLKTLGIIISLAEATHIIDTYRGMYFAIPGLWAQGDRCLAAIVNGQSAPYGKDGVVRLVGRSFHTPLGIPLKYHQLRRVTKPNGQVEFIYTSRTGVKGIWGGALTENCVQHLARLIIGEQMLRVARRYKVVLTVHDSIVCIALEAEAVEARAYVEECMRWVPKWAGGLPLDCESGVGENYGES